MTRRKLALAYHDQEPGFDPAWIRAACDGAVKGGKYEKMAVVRRCAPDFR